MKVSASTLLCARACVLLIYYSSKSGARRRCGFPIGLISDPKSANDQDDYSIRDWIIWIGFFQGSTSIIDTSMFGQIDLEITLAPSGVLGLGALPAAATITAVTAANSEKRCSYTNG